MLDDPAELGEVEGDVVAPRLLTDGHAGATAPQHDGLARVVRGTDRLGQRLGVRGVLGAGGRQAMDRVAAQIHMPSASARFMRSVGIAAQTSPPGKIFPGFITPSGSKAARARCIASRSSGP